jgi:hypothetical protein
MECLLLHVWKRQPFKKEAETVIQYICLNRLSGKDRPISYFLCIAINNNPLADIADTIPASRAWSMKRYCRLLHKIHYEDFRESCIKIKISQIWYFFEVKSLSIELLFQHTRRITTPNERLKVLVAFFQFREGPSTVAWYFVVIVSTYGRMVRKVHFQRWYI